MLHLFLGASSFLGNGLNTWNVAVVTNMNNTFNGATSLTSCNKRKIADAWASSTVFNYGSEWASDTCVGSRFTDPEFKTASWGTYNNRFILYHTSYTPWHTRHPRVLYPPR